MYSRSDSRVILDDEVPCRVADTLNRVNLRALPHSYSQWHVRLFITSSNASLSGMNLRNQHQHRFSRYLEIFTQAHVLSSKYSYSILKPQFNPSDYLKAYSYCRCELYFHCRQYCLKNICCIEIALILHALPTSELQIYIVVTMTMELLELSARLTEWSIYPFHLMGLGWKEIYQHYKHIDFFEWCREYITQLLHIGFEYIPLICVSLRYTDLIVVGFLP